MDVDAFVTRSPISVAGVSLSSPHSVLSSFAHVSMGLPSCGLTVVAGMCVHFHTEQRVVKIEFNKEVE